MMKDRAPAHPLPRSGEARHGEIPEDAERKKGTGDDEEAVVAPSPEAANPDGSRYPAHDLGR